MQEEQSPTEPNRPRRPRPAPRAGDGEADTSSSTKKTPAAKKSPAAKKTTSATKATTVRKASGTKAASTKRAAFDNPAARTTAKKAAAGQPAAKTTAKRTTGGRRAAPTEQPTPTSEVTTPTRLPPAAEPNRAASPGVATPAPRTAENSRPGNHKPVRRGAELAGGPLGWRLVDRPERAPELLALAAVQTVGPRARDWAAGLRAAYPHATPDGLAALATRRFVRLAGVSAAASTAAGLFAPVAELAASSWVRAALVLHLAAAYGVDPTDPERAVELLVFAGIEPDSDTARQAVRRARADAGHKRAGNDLGMLVSAGRRLAAPLLAQGGGWFGVRLAARLLPGAALLAAAGGGSAGAERMAARATAHYRARRTAAAQSQSNQDRGSTE